MKLAVTWEKNTEYCSYLCRVGFLSYQRLAEKEGREPRVKENGRQLLADGYTLLCSCMWKIHNWFVIFVYGGIYAEKTY